MSRAPIAFALLAAGASTRFGAPDKLMAPLGGQPLIARAGRRLQARDGIERLAVVAPQAPARRSWLASAGWQLIENPHAAHGQGTSVARAARAARERGARALLIALADMPFVSDTTLERLIAAIETHEAAMCQGPEGLMPPAIFSAGLFNRLEALGGDRGARTLFDQADSLCRIELAPGEARDIDTPGDLAALEKEAAHA